jgi:hypothetical protein
MERDEAIQLIRNSGLKQYANPLINSLMASARIIVDDETTSQTDNCSTSYFGGSPCMPTGTPWPIWDKSDYLGRKAARLEEKFRQSPRATGLRDIAARMREESRRGPAPLSFIGQLQLREIQSCATLSG